MNSREVVSARRRVLARLERRFPFWRDMARRIHAHPELAFEEHRACAWLAEALAQAGFAVERGVGGLPTAFRAAFDTAPRAPVVALMAEYDALPETGHSCGHHLSGAASCLAADALAGGLGSLGLRVRVIGTPAEEKGGGKIALLRAGVFDGVDAAMMAHAGFVSLTVRDMIGQRRVRAEFRARKGDPVANTQDAAALCLHAVEALRRGLPPRMRLEAILAEGGRLPPGPAARVRPDYRRAVAEFVVHGTAAPAILAYERRIAHFARAAARVAGATVRWQGHWCRYLPMRRNAALEDVYTRSLQAIGEPIGTFPADAGIGSTDCGTVSHSLPAIHPYFKTVGFEAGIDHHTHAFTAVGISPEGFAGMHSAARAMALAAFEFAADPTLRARVWRDFRAAGPPVIVD